ncbi:alpha-tubulin binding protein [Aureococcus anophagefferens]|uniref:Alpha-tubulin binding protein n=1 Tax=Aureococcus anophagefferens TaxID=44056 RepID=A0ABR1G6H7_AURAN
MRYVFASTGQQVEVPLLPGLALRGDAWYSRAATPGGFNKTQVLAQEWTMAHPSGGENRAATAKGSPRCASLLGASAAAGGDGPGSPAASPAKPSSPRPSSRSPRRPGSRSAGRGPVDEDAAFTSEATAAFAPSSLAPMERPGVLRFAAYFTESTEWAFSGELGKPSDRGVQVRKCFVLFHLEDGTVEVLEERTSNSGVAGGRFFNRAPPGAAGMGWKTQPAPGVGAPSTAGPEGLEVGGELVFLGQTFYLVDADGFTRDWYARVFGKTQPPAVDYPVATPREYHAEHATGLGKAAGGVAYGKGGGFEVFRKSPEAGVRKQQMNKERQFFSHEGEVLKFVVTWDDPSPGGQQHEYKLCFYLSDSCAELCTSPQPGFDRFPHLLRRQPLPLNWDAIQRGAPPRHAAAEDLKIGATINVYNRILKLVDCTQFTRNWYREALGVVQPPSQHTPKPPPSRGGAAKKSPKKPVDDGAPSFTASAFCDEEHGYATSTMHGYSGKQCDWDRELKVQDKTIRCRLVPVRPDGTTKPRSHASANAIEEPRRTFILTYFLPDNTLSIFEEHVNNSGVIGGAFLKRGKYKVPDEAGSGAMRYFSPTDFYLGALQGSKRVIEVDGASLKTMAEMADEFPFSDPAKVVPKLAAAAAAAGVDVVAMLKEATPPGLPPGLMPEGAFKLALTTLGLAAALNDHEMLTLCAAFAKGGGNTDVAALEAAL